MHGYITADITLSSTYASKISNLGLTLYRIIGSNTNIEDNIKSKEFSLIPKKLINNSISFPKCYAYYFVFSQPQKYIFQIDSPGLSIIPIYTCLPEIIFNKLGKSYDLYLANGDKIGCVKFLNETKKTPKDKAIDFKLMIKKSDKLKKILKTNYPSVCYTVSRKLAKEKDFVTLHQSNCIDHKESLFKKWKTTLGELSGNDPKSKTKINICQIDETSGVLKILHEIKLPIKNIETKDTFALTENGATIQVETIKGWLGEIRWKLKLPKVFRQSYGNRNKS